MSGYLSIRLTQMTDNAILNRIHAMASANAYTSVSVGVFDNTIKEGETASPVQKARICEFGAVHAGRNIPPRSFLRTTCKERRNAWLKFLHRKLRGKVFSDRNAVRDALKALGEKMVVDVKKKLVSHVSPANEPKYFVWKLHNVMGANGYRGTLARTGGLYDSIEYRLYRKRESKATE